MNNTFTFTDAELNTLQLAVANLNAEAPAVAADDSDFSELPELAARLHQLLNA